MSEQFLKLVKINNEHLGSLFGQFEGIQFLNEDNKVFATLCKKCPWESISCLLHYTDENLVQTKFFQEFINKNDIPEISVLSFVSKETFNTQKFILDFKSVADQIGDLFVVFDDPILLKNIKEKIVNIFKNRFITETNNSFANNSLEEHNKCSVVKLITNGTLIKLFKNE